MEEKNFDCPSRKKCNACQMLNLSYQKQLENKQNRVKRLFSPFCRVESIIGMEHPAHYRNKAQAVFSNENGKIVWGVYKSTTKTPAKTNNCMLHTKRANEIFTVLCKLFKSFKITPYDPYKSTGFLKSVLIRQGFNSGEIMVVICSMKKVFPAKKTFATALKKACPQITTAVICHDKSEDKLFVGEVSEVLFGDGYIKDRLCGLVFIISPDSFFQINPIQTKKLYETAISFASLSKKDVILDAYCGVGTIGLLASKHCKQVISVERDKCAVSDGIKNAKLNKISNVKFVCADATDFIRENPDNFDIIFIDPPRAGCTREFIDTALESKPQKVVYISCNIETQLRDLKQFKKHGYQAVKCQPVDMFPHTNHIENILLLEQENKHNP